MESLLDLRSLGVARTGDANHETKYLIADREIRIEVEDVPQRRGGVKYAIDQQANPKTIVITPGGLFGEGCLIAGQIGTASDDTDSIALYELFHREFKSRFKKVKSYLVGAEARALLDKGWRLTSSIKAPIDYDLRAR
jgi:hypothetical protein